MSMRRIIDNINKMCVLFSFFKIIAISLKDQYDAVNLKLCLVYFWLMESVMVYVSVAFPV